MLIVDYYFVRKRKLVIPDLFIGGPESIYWFNNGINWRAIFCLLFAMWPSMRKNPLSVNPTNFPIIRHTNIKEIAGLVNTVSGKNMEPSATVWTRMFQINYLIGAPLAFITYYAISYFIKPPGLGLQVDLDEQGLVIEGVSSEGAPSENFDSGNEKEAHITDKAVE